MKLKIMTLICLSLTLGLLFADDEVFGAFQIKTTPRGAEISVYDTEQSLGTTPTEIFPVYEDEYMTQYNGIPGRFIEIVISRDGYVPLQKEIFVPLNKLTIREAIRKPTVFNFRMKRTFSSSFGLHAFFWPTHHRPRHTQHFYPWYPHNPRPKPPHNPPYNPPGGSHGGSVNPPGGGGSHGGGSNPPGGGSNGGGSNPPGGGSHGGGSNPPGGGSHGDGSNGGGSNGGGHSGEVAPPVPSGNGNGGHVSPPNQKVEKPAASSQGTIQAKPPVSSKPSDDKDEGQIRKSKTRK